MALYMYLLYLSQSLLVSGSKGQFASIECIKENGQFAFSVTCRNMEFQLSFPWGGGLYPGEILSYTRVILELCLQIL